MKEWKTLSLGRDLSPEEIEKAIEEALNELQVTSNFRKTLSLQNWI
jgi:7-cyano-7-deazaguanine synthase